tara:strand:- start:353 stop:1102 length:750 start_codon:yes stop_codon:yes gene_type:complete
MATVKCDIPSFNVVGAGHIRISGGTSLIKPHYFENELLSLEFTNGKVISKGENLIIKNKSYKINLIQKTKRKGILFYDLKTCNRNKACLFVTPMLGGNKSLWFYTQSLINTFIGIKDDVEDKIILLYKTSRDPLFLKFLNTIQKFKAFEEVRDLDKDHLIVIFNVPKKHKKDFLKFKNGKYSEMSQLYKVKILEYHEMSVEGIIGQILFKSKKRKRKLEKMIGMELPDDAEVYSIPNPKTELLNTNYYL